jgi:hypothetical protein
MTFSRYLWAYTLLGLLLAYGCSKWDRVQGAFLVVAAIGISSMFGLLVQVVTFRFSSAVAGSSDLERVVQNQALREFFISAPVFGHGLGSYTSAVIRSEALPYSYENQIGALAGQVGVVGCILLLTLTGYYYFKAVRESCDSFRYKIALIILLAVWIFGGFLNPQLISSSASVSYGFLLALALTGQSGIDWRHAGGPYA